MAALLTPLIMVNLQELLATVGWMSVNTLTLDIYYSGLQNRLPLFRAARFVLGTDLLIINVLNSRLSLAQVFP
jgi:hypothetical protein